MNDTKKRVLFICSRNACRSQMAEAIVNHELGDSWHAESAGTEPSRPNPLMLLSLSEIGIDHSAATSKHLDRFVDEHFDLVITLCGDANEVCPVFVGGVRREHLGFENPDAAVGSDEERMVVFRRVLGQIREKIPARLRAFEQGKPEVLFELGGELAGK